MFLPPFVHKFTHENSVKAHFSKCHPGVSPKEAYVMKQRGDEDLRARMSQRGHAVGAHKRREREAALDKIQAKGGHCLRYITFRKNPKKNKRGATASMMLICKHCRGMGTPSTFQKQCIGEKRWNKWKPLLESVVAEMRGNLQAYEDFVPLQEPERSSLVALAPVRFRFCRKRPPTLSDRDPRTLMTNRAKELAEAKFLRLVAENIEPQPALTAFGQHRLPGSKGSF